MLSNKTLLTTVFILASVSVSHAYDGEYFTYGNFDTVYEAFRAMSLIFSDSFWKVFVFVVATMGIFWGITGSITKSMVGKTTSVLGPTAVYVLTGTIVYLALFSPASMGRLTIYDKNLNKHGQVTLPTGIVAVAHVLSEIEDKIIEIIDISRPIDTPSLRESSMYIGFDTLKNLTNPRNWKDSYMYVNVGNYIKECVFFEMKRPGGRITSKDIESSPISLVNILERANSPAVHVVIHSSENDNIGQPMTCEAAWRDHVSRYLTNEQNFVYSVKTACANSGVDMNDPIQVSRCRDIISNIVRYLTSYHISAEKLSIDTNIAYVLAQKIEQSGNEGFYAQVTQRGVRDSIGALMGFDKFMPLLRGYLVAAVIGISVFLIVFLPTPLFSKILSTVLGLWVWLTVWAICDAVVHRISLNTVYRSFEYIRENNLAMSSLLSMPSYASNSLVMLGTFRGLGLMLATIVSGSLMKFAGSHAMAMMAGKMSGQLQSVGQLAAPYGVAGTSEHIDALRKISMDTIPTMHNINKFGRGTITDTVTAKTLGDTGANVEMMRQFGGVRALEEIHRDTILGRTIGQATKGAAMRDYGLANAFAAGLFDHRLKLHQQTALMDVVKQFAQENNIPLDRAMEEYAKFKVATDKSIMEVFDNAGNYQKFLEANQLKAQGDTDAFIKIAKEAGMRIRDFAESSRMIDLYRQLGILDAIRRGELTPQDIMRTGAVTMLSEAGGAEALESVASGMGMSVKDFVKNDKLMEGLRKSGAIEAFAERRITKQDLKDIGYYNLLSEEGRKEAAHKLAALTGGRYEDYVERLETLKGMQDFIKFRELQNLADKHNMGIEDLFAAIARTTKITVSGDMAKELGLPGAGLYTVGWNEKGKFVYFKGDSGKEYRIASNFINEAIQKTIRDTQDVDRSGTVKEGAPGVTMRDTAAIVNDILRGNAAQELLKGDKVTRDLALLQQTVDFTNAVNALLSHIGSVSSSVSAEIGLRKPGVSPIKAGVSAETGTQTTINVNEIAKDYQKRVGEAVKTGNLERVKQAQIEALQDALKTKDLGVIQRAIKTVGIGGPGKISSVDKDDIGMPF